MKTLVLSVFCACDRLADLYRLQRHFLDQHAGDYTHAVYLRRISDVGLFDRSLIVGQTMTRAAGGPSKDHVEGLQELLRYARSVASDYDAMMILDSDAWPVGNIEKFLTQHDVGCVVRTDNLDVFNHPCGVIFLSKHCDRISVDLTHSKNLLGQSIHDTIINAGALAVWPLVRSNRVNMHPVFGGVYGNLFFHVGCGSRKVDGRGVKRYWRGINHQQCADDLWQQLCDDPDGLIKRLTLGV